MKVKHCTGMYFYDEDGERHDFEAIQVTSAEGYYWVTVDPDKMQYPEYREAMTELAKAGLERTIERAGLR